MAAVATLGLLAGLRKGRSSSSDRPSARIGMEMLQPSLRPSENASQCVMHGNGRSSRHNPPDLDLVHFATRPTIRRRPRSRQLVTCGFTPERHVRDLRRVRPPVQGRSLQGRHDADQLPDLPGGCRPRGAVDLDRHGVTLLRRRSSDRFASFAWSESRRGERSTGCMLHLFS